MYAWKSISYILVDILATYTYSTYQSQLTNSVYLSLIMIIIIVLSLWSSAQVLIEYIS